MFQMPNLPHSCNLALMRPNLHANGTHLKINYPKQFHSTLLPISPSRPNHTGQIEKRRSAPATSCDHHCQHQRRLCLLPMPSAISACAPVTTSAYAHHRPVPPLSLRERKESAGTALYFPLWHVHLLMQKPEISLPFSKRKKKTVRCGVSSLCLSIVYDSLVSSIFLSLRRFCAKGTREWRQANWLITLLSSQI